MAQEGFPAGALLRDPRNPAAIDIRVISSDADYIVVSTSGAKRKYKRRESLLRRWLLPARTAVAVMPEGNDKEPRAGIVLGIHGDASPNGPWSYVVHTEAGGEVISERSLRVLKVETDDPVSRLELNAWRGPRRFFARLALLERTTVWKQDSEGIPALLGARVEPLFHQFYAARRVLMDREPRFLLADEVGLGKTIEAGLVIQALLAAKQDLRVVIVSPGTTSRQWLSELYGRFGGRVFTHVDTVRYDSADESAKSRDRLLRSDLLIVTTPLLRTRPKALAAVIEQPWDLLVVDEGHQLVNWPELAMALRRVSAAATGSLVLTATPGRGDEKGLLELLKLVAPGIYGNVTEREFAARLEPQRKITEKLLYSQELVAALLAQGEVGAEDARELAGQWRDLFPSDPIVADCIKRMDAGEGDAAEELVAHIQENYRVDRRIIRTRRRTLGEYGTHHAPRASETLAYEACAAEIEVADQVEELLTRPDVPATWKAFWCRQVCTTPALLQRQLKERLNALPTLRSSPQEVDPLAADLGPQEEEVALEAYLRSGPTFNGEGSWLENTQIRVQRWHRAEGSSCARFKAVREWLAPGIASRSRKTLIFSQSRHVIEELALDLRTAFGADAVAVMTHDLGDQQIAEISRRFEKQEKCLVLLSDEIGAEGRNFQFADAVLHLDQPAIVARLEQRIGRLDRIGRSEDRPVTSVSVTGPFEGEAALADLHRDVFRVHQRSIGGLEYLLPRIQRDVHRAATQGAAALRALAVELRPKLEDEESRIDEAFSFFLDATRPELERAKELAELVAERTGDEDESCVRDWCKELHVDLVPLEAGCFRAEVRVERLESPLNALGVGDWIRAGTFQRDTALDNPAVQYFAPGHVLIDSLLQNALETHDARATVFFRDLGGQAKGRVFVVVIGRLVPDEAAWKGSVSPGLVRRAEHYLPSEWVRSVWEVHQDGDVSAVPPGPLLEGLRKDFQDSDRKCHPDHMPGIVERYSGLWVGLRAAVGASKDAILASKRDEIDAAASDLGEVLRSEFAFLRSKQDPNSESTSVELREREGLLESVRRPAVISDAAAIVIGGGGR